MFLKIYKLYQPILLIKYDWIIIQSLKMFETLYSIIKNYDDKSFFKEINNDPKKKMIVSSIHDMNLLHTLYPHHTMILDPKDFFLIFYIPNSTKIMINLFCCNFKMADIYHKISTHGIAIEGKFNINPVTNIPMGHYSGNIITKDINPRQNHIKGKKILRKNHYLIIDNHRLIKILDGCELINYKPTGINLQCVEGMRIISNKVPVQQNDKINSMIVIAIDISNNILIIHHPHISMNDMISFLLYLQVNDAINICDSNNPHLIWKDKNNQSNDDMYIGDINEVISNAIVFSS